MRICAAQTRFAVKEVDIGLAADIGTLSRLPRCVGNFGWVKDVCLSARDFSAAEALAVGFVSQVHDTKAAAVEAGVRMAAFLAAKSPVAVQGTKEILNHARDHSVDESTFDLPHPLSDQHTPSFVMPGCCEDEGLTAAIATGLRYTAIWNSAMLQSDDVSAALLSGIQKRKPTFEKL